MPDIIRVCSILVRSCRGWRRYGPLFDLYRAIDLRRDTSLICHSERNEESLVWLTRFLVSLGMTEERLSALSLLMVALYSSRELDFRE